jgi:hypothetical protein
MAVYSPLYRGQIAYQFANVLDHATNFCSQTIATKLKGVSVSAAKEDQVKTEQRAFTIGLELREKRASR